MPVQVPENESNRPVLGVGSTRNGHVDFTDQMDSSEVLNGSPTLVEVGTSDLTITNVAINSAALDSHPKGLPSRTAGGGNEVAIGKAVQFTASGMLEENSPYTLLCTSTTDGGQTLTLEPIFTAE